ncbi:MAG: hypothetical protein ACYC6N_22820 [Pirellulaceae bacterium]
MKKLLCVLALVAVMASPAFAGGGSKADSTIRITNNGTNAGGAVGAVVIVDPPGGVGYTPTSIDQILDDGGKVLNFGATQSFKVKAGTHVVWAVFGDANEDPVGTAVSRAYHVQKKQTLNVGLGNGAVLNP